MGQDFWISLLKYALFAGGMFLFSKWINNSRKAKSKNDSKIRYPKSSLILGLLGFGFFAGIAIISNVYSNETVTWITTSVFCGFASLGLIPVFMYFFVYYELSDEGLVSKMVWKHKYIKWSEIKRVKYHKTGYFRVKAKDGETIDISVFLVGLPTFAQLLLKHSTPEVIEANSLDIIEATAQGILPDVL